MKTYEKLTETSFKVSETKKLESEINVLEQLENMATQLSWIKKIIWQTKQLKETVIKTVERYNTWADILNEAKDKCWLAFKKLDKIQLADDFVLENLNIEDFPKIDIRKDD